MSTLFSFLAKYEAVSGQCINQTKSFYVSKRVSPAHLRVIASISGIEVGHLPFKYLGCTMYIENKYRLKTTSVMSMTPKGY